MKDKIQKTALELFKKHGIHYVSLDLIAKSLGISKKTIYNHFKNKEEIVHRCIEQYFEERTVQNDAILEEAEHTIEALVKVIKSSLKHTARINPLMFEEIIRYYPEVSSLITEKHYSKRYIRLREMIEQGKKEGLFKKHINSDIMAKVFLSQINLTMDYDTFPLDEYSREDLVEHIFFSFISGISTYKGQAVITEYLEEHG
ncbi:TetR/AcrR family transcriptional regulator [Balneolales bacterium ANBcel1]|nr:TetR/AcrR family transcriptional regulator [Balneolales bacterium ANBcel1]